MARYQVQIEESDCSLSDVGESTGNKQSAIRLARYMAKSERKRGSKSLNALVFDNTTEMYVFVAKVQK